MHNVEIPLDFNGSMFIIFSLWPPVNNPRVHALKFYNVLETMTKNDGMITS